MENKGYVKVMRSYDYCHFEVCLGVDDDATTYQVNERRKEAAILVDEAIRQYRIAKEAEGKRQSKLWECEKFLEKVEKMQEIPKSELTIEQTAFLRAYADREFLKSYDEDAYYYAEEERDYHFSMLDRFKKATVKAG